MNYRHGYDLLGTFDTNFTLCEVDEGFEFETKGRKWRVIFTKYDCFGAHTIVGEGQKPEAAIFNYKKVEF